MSKKKHIPTKQEKFIIEKLQEIEAYLKSNELDKGSAIVLGYMNLSKDNNNISTLFNTINGMSEDIAEIFANILNQDEEIKDIMIFACANKFTKQDILKLIQAKAEQDNCECENCVRRIKMQGQVKIPIMGMGKWHA